MQVQARYKAAALWSTAAVRARRWAQAAARTAAGQARIGAQKYREGPGSTGALANSEARCTAAPRRGREDRAGDTPSPAGGWSRRAPAGGWSRERRAEAPGRRAERRKGPAGGRSDGTPLPGERAGTRAAGRRESPAGIRAGARAGGRAGRRARELMGFGAGEPAEP